MGVTGAGKSAVAQWLAAELDLELAEGGLLVVNPGLHGVGVLGVLGSAGDGEVAVGLSLLGAVTRGVAAGLHQLGVGDAGGRGTEHHTQDGSDRDEEPRPAEDGTGDSQGREDNQDDSDREPGAPLPATSRGGRHGRQVTSRSRRFGRDTLAPGAPL